MSRAAALALAAGIAMFAASPGIAEGLGPSAPPGCAAPATLLAIAPALTRTAGQIERQHEMTIVAVGSSSTEGIGASTPSQSYPSRLEVELKRRLPDTAVRVVNRGKGGEEVPQMLKRLDRDVVAEHPDLVIWQLGTNAVLRHEDVSGERELMQHGIARLRQAGSDIVLMDMQYAPRVVARPAFAAMKRMIAGVAARAGVGLFRRFDIMRYWHTAEPEAAMIGPDGLHMTDAGYGCLAADLADALAANWRGPGAAPPEPTVAGLAAPRHAAAAAHVPTP